MILNNDPTGQANVLAQIMDFLSHTPVEKLISCLTLIQLMRFTFLVEILTKELL